jgi:hypothetical protein
LVPNTQQGDQYFEFSKRMEYHFEREVIYMASLIVPACGFQNKKQGFYRCFIGCNEIINGGRQGYTIRQNKMISATVHN